MAWKVYFFQTARGNYPVKEFIDELDLAAQTKAAKYIRLLADYGPYLKPPYIKKLQEKLYELRITGKIAVRIFYTFTRGEYFLLHAFKKKSEKTPQSELQTALDRMKELI